MQGSSTRTNPAPGTWPTFAIILPTVRLWNTDGIHLVIYHAETGSQDAEKLALLGSFTAG